MDLGYKISFNSINKNVIDIYNMDDRYITSIVCPPCENGCDIIRYDSVVCIGYTYKFDGLLLITTDGCRNLYYDGKLIAKNYE